MILCSMFKQKCLTEKKYYLALQLSSLVHRDIILTLHSFDSQYAALRHCPDLQDTCQTITQSENGDISQDR